MAKRIPPGGNRSWALRWSVLAGLVVLLGTLSPFHLAHRRSISPGQSTPSTPLSGPVSWWPGTSNAVDIAGTNHGAVPPSGMFASGKLGTAFSFNGSDAEQNREGEAFDAIRIPGFGMNLPASEITIEFWQKAERPQVQQSVSLSPYDYTHVCRCIATYPDGIVCFDFGNNHAEGQLIYRPPVSIFGSWQHFVFVASQAGNIMKIYRNGALEAQKLGMTPFENTNYDLLIGDGFTGLIDEVKIYNRALSAAEILSVYNAGSGMVASATSPAVAAAGQPDGEAGDDTASIPLPAGKGQEIP